jgi:GH43 family beta-xylosidase
VQSRLSLSLDLSLRDDVQLESELPAATAAAEAPQLCGPQPARALNHAASQIRYTFTNPIIPAPSADPWMIYHNGFYYYAESRNHTTIHIRKSRSIVDIGLDDGVKVWTPPVQGPNCKGVWAPELHFISGKWYIYYAADDGENENHRMFVLESESDDPQGRYFERGSLETNGWAIDGTVLRLDNGRMYFIWSGWPGKANGRQNLYIAPMSDPCTVSGERVMIATPSQSWETVEMAICEGPQVLQRNGKIFIIYSASGSWTVDYCLGMLAFRGGDVLDPNAWEKRGPVFQKTRSVWGVGHCSFVQTPDRKQDWIVYHAKSKRKSGWGDRNVHAQPFGWHADGSPDFGIPVAPAIPCLAPEA